MARDYHIITARDDRTREMTTAAGSAASVNAQKSSPELSRGRQADSISGAHRVNHHMAGIDRSF